MLIVKLLLLAPWSSAIDRKDFELKLAGRAFPSTEDPPLD